MVTGSVAKINLEVNFGFGGIGALKKLGDADIRIMLIDKHDYHTFQPLLYQVATEELTPEQVGFPIRDVLHHHQNVTFHQAVVLNGVEQKISIFVDLGWTLLTKHTVNA
jgi:NADH:ubiquinone reductase (H+-translocating)